MIVNTQFNIQIYHYLIDLDSRIDFRDKPEASKESYGTGEQANSGGHDGHVSEIEYCTWDFWNVELRVEEVDTVEEKVDSCHSWSEEWTPPPVVVFCCQVEVA